MNKQAVYELNQNWAAMKGYLRIEHLRNQPVTVNWYYDEDDPDESSIVGRLRAAFLLTDSSGRSVLSISTRYANIGREPPRLIQERVRAALASPDHKNFYDIRYAGGTPYLVRAGVVFDELRMTPYYGAIAIPFTADQRALNVFTYILIGALVFAVILGWALNRTVRA